MTALLTRLRSVERSICPIATCYVMLCYDVNKITVVLGPHTQGRLLSLGVICRNILPYNASTEKATHTPSNIRIIFITRNYDHRANFCP